MLNRPSGKPGCCRGSTDRFRQTSWITSLARVEYLSMAEKEKLYKFEELSKEAKERAIEQWREKGYDFDDNDAQFLTEDFKEILKERGFYDPKVYWSLGYCQGDGVCFEGAIEPSELFKQKGFGRFKELAEHIGIRVRSDGRMCHSNSMDLEVEYTSSYADFIDRDIWRAIEEFEYQQSQIKRGRKQGAFEWVPGEVEMPARYRRAIDLAKKKRRTSFEVNR